MQREKIFLLISSGHGIFDQASQDASRLLAKQIKSIETDLGATAKICFVSEKPIAEVLVLMRKTRQDLQAHGVAVVGNESNGYLHDVMGISIGENVGHKIIPPLRSQNVRKISDGKPAYGTSLARLGGNIVCNLFCGQALEDMCIKVIIDMGNKFGVGIMPDEKSNLIYITTTAQYKPRVKEYVAQKSQGLLVCEDYPAHELYSAFDGNVLIVIPRERNRGTAVRHIIETYVQDFNVQGVIFAGGGVMDIPACLTIKEYKEKFPLGAYTIGPGNADKSLAGYLDIQGAGYVLDGVVGAIEKALLRCQEADHSEPCR